MLKVKTYLDKSTIPNIGIGLFADEKIEKDTVIWEYVEGLDFTIPNFKLEYMSELNREFVKKYGYFDEEWNAYVVCVDNARFFNHSVENSNTYEESHSLHRNGRTIANRTIEKGEELLCNYFEFDSTAQEKLTT